MIGVGGYPQATADDFVRDPAAVDARIANACHRVNADSNAT